MENEKLTEGYVSSVGKTFLHSRRKVHTTIGKHLYHVLICMYVWCGILRKLKWYESEGTDVVRGTVDLKTITGVSR